jgi:hypothetical protein
MWRRNALFVALLLTHEVAETGYGQERSTAPLLSRSPWAQFELVLGRITSLPVHRGQRRTLQTSNTAGDVQETLMFNGDADVPVLVYQRQDPDQTIKVQVIHGTQIRLERHVNADVPAPAIRFEQSRRGNATLAIGGDDSTGQYVAESLWHLLLAEPDVCREHLIPLLRLLRPDWQLLETAEEIEAQLCQSTAAETASRQQIAELVDQLDSRRFKTRQAADRRLRSLGLCALPHLDHLDLSTLSGEQRLRVRRIRQDLRVLTPDTSQRVATWLMNDEKMWRQWLTHDAPYRREAAARGLAFIHHVPSTDPSNSDGRGRLARSSALGQTIE